MLPLTLERNIFVPSGEKIRPVKLSCPSSSGSRICDETVAGFSPCSFSEGKSTSCKTSPVTGSTTINSLDLPEVTSIFPSGLNASACGREPSSSTCLPLGVKVCCTAGRNCSLSFVVAQLAQTGQNPNASNRLSGHFDFPSFIVRHLKKIPVDYSGFSSTE